MSRVAELPDPVRFERLSSCLDLLLELEPAARTERLEEIATAEPVLADELRALLAAAVGEGPLSGSATAFGAALFADQEPELDRAGERIGPFRLGAELGRGGMGTVFSAERVEGGFGQTVAVKIVKRGLDTDEVLKRFAGERRILARLEHPHIARLVDGGLTRDGRPWFAMEPVDGRPITEHAARLPTAARIALFLEVCDAVAFAHRNLVVHRDLKPSNVLVDGSGRVKLLDFGIAKLLSGDADDPGERLTRTEAAPMTPQYAAPEQKTGGAISTLTDVYQLGRLLEEMLATPVSESRARRDLERIVARARHDDPARRYPSVEALADDLRRYLDGRPVAARPDTLGYRAARFVARHRLGVAAAVAVVLALVAGLALALTARAREARAAQRATATRDFLVRLFEEASPERNGGVTPTLADVLDQGTRRIDQELAAEPALRAELLATLAQIELELGEFDRGLELAKSQRRLVDEISPRDSRERVESAALLGEALHRKELDAEALVELDRGRLAAVKLDGVDGLLVASIANVRANVLARLGRREEAGREAALALEIYERRLGRNAPETIAALADRMSTVYDESDYRRALELARDVLARRRATVGPQHPAVARALHDVAVSAQELDRNEEAESAYREALAIHVAASGADHPRTLETRESWGSFLVRLGRFDEAEAELLGTAEGWKRRSGETSYSYGDTLNTLAIVFYQRGRYRDAADLFERVAKAFDASLGPENPSTTSVRANLGATLCEAGELDRAEAVLRSNLELLERTAGSNRLTTLSFLGRVMRERGRLEEAEKHHRELLEITTASFGAENTWTSTARYQLGLDLARGHRESEAGELLEAALAIDRKLRPATHPRLAEILIALAELDRDGGRKERARERVKEAVEIRRSALGVDDARTVAAERLLASLG